MPGSHRPAEPLPPRPPPCPKAPPASQITPAKQEKCEKTPQKAPKRVKITTFCGMETREKLMVIA